uniref:FH2 domain-containing protein n=1 Tax=Phytophthora ramorum TaxID=164328 RepID=H3HAW7_PHYRM
MGAPAPAVKAQMLQAGLNSELLDTPDAEMLTSTSHFDSMPAAPEASTNPRALLFNMLASRAAPQPDPQVKVKDDPQYAKFFKLLASDTASAQAETKVKDDPAYAKFFKLLSMGAPAESVKAKIRMAGLKPDLLNTPDALMSSVNAPAPAAKVAVKISILKLQFNRKLSLAPVNQPAAPAPNTTAARRAHLSIAIKPVVKTKTRAFYWQQLKAEAIRGTIWEELEKEHSNQSNQDLLTLTEKELELLETEFPPPAASRSNNISIIVKQFRMSNAALRVAIMKMDSEVLTLDRVQGLIKILPTEEEIAAISGFHGDPTTLNGAELVLKELITVPRLKQRLSALETKHQFPALVRDLQTKINKIRVASNEIAQSSELKTLLLVILQVGNKMNDGTARGGAKGFRLNDLTKLVQLKSVDKSVTLLHYVARMVRMKKGNAVRLGDSLASLYDVQSIPIPELQGDMNRINDITENINVELAAQRLKNRIEEREEIDLFVESMTVFVDESIKEVTTMKKELDEALRLIRDIMLRFDKSADDDEAPPPSADAPLPPAALTGAGEFFSIIYEFTMSLMKADRENELKRIRDEKRLKQQELKSATPRPEAQETPRRKSMIAVTGTASFQTEVEAEGDDHDNNNSEPSSPEKALSEAEPSTRVAVESDA